MIKRVVLDVIIPKKGPSIVEIAEGLSKAKGVVAVNITVKEIDMETENIIMVIEGNDIDFREITRIIEELGGVIIRASVHITGKSANSLQRLALQRTVAAEDTTDEL